MSVRSFTLSILAVLWLCSTSAFAQIEQWQNHMDAATTAYKQGISLKEGAATEMRDGEVCPDET